MKKAVQIFLSPCEGKRMIADALISREDVRTALREHTVVVITGSTNAFLAESICSFLNAPPFEKEGFYRGIIRSDGPAINRNPGICDLIVERGKLLSGRTIFDVAEQLTAGDIIFKGANAVHLSDRAAGVLVGNPKGGTIIPILAAASGRRATLIHPVGLEKRVERPIADIARFLNQPGESGLRMLPSTGTPYTELDALSELFSVSAELIASGGGGGCLLRAEGEAEDVSRLAEYLKPLRGMG